MTLFAFRGAKSHEWTFCDSSKWEHKKIPGHSAGLKEGRKGLPLPCDRGEKGAFARSKATPVPTL